MSELFSLLSGALLLLLLFILFASFSFALQSSSVEGCSRAMRLFKEDGLLKIFSLVVILSALLLLGNFAFSPWISRGLLLLGVAALTLFYSRGKTYLDPYGLLKHLSEIAQGASHPLKQKELCEAVDGIAEVVSKAIWQKSLGLAKEGLGSFQELMKGYLLRKTAVDKEAVNFTTIYLLERLEMLFIQSVEAEMSALAGQIAGETLKLTLPLTKFDRGAATLPIHFAGRFLEMAREKGLYQTVGTIESAELEIAKALIRTPELKNQGAGMLLLSLIAELEESAKENFKKDKNSSIPFLMEPFSELKKEAEKIDFPDRDSVISDLNRVITEFETLQSVLISVPNIPGYQKPEGAGNRA